jgi:virginiamycin B lyase
MKRLSCAVALVLGVAALVAAGLASASGQAAKKPTFKVYLKATHGVVLDLAHGPDGRVWFTQQFADRIGAITDAGAVHQYVAGAKNGQPSAIALGSDKRLWYTEYGSGKVEAMTATGVRTEYSTGAVVNSLVGIGGTGGHAIWVGGEFSQLWLLNMSGGIVKHIVPPALAASRIPSTFVTGKDTRTWVNLGVYIAAIDASGKVTEYTTGYQANPKIRDMVLGPDGNIWFTDSQELTRIGAIGRITPAGAVTYFQKGLKKGSAPMGITVGPDRYLWFTENRDGAHVGRITTKGVITLYKIPITPAYSATSITRGQGRHLWVASNGLAGLVRVAVP